MVENSKKETVRIMVTLDKEQQELLRTVRGMGKKDAEILKNIVLAWLAEKSYLKSYYERQDQVTR